MSAVSASTTSKVEKPPDTSNGGDSVPRKRSKAINDMNKEEIQSKIQFILKQKDLNDTKLKRSELNSIKSDAKEKEYILQIETLTKQLNNEEIDLDKENEESDDDVDENTTTGKRKRTKVKLSKAEIKAKITSYVEAQDKNETKKLKANMICSQCVAKNLFFEFQLHNYKKLVSNLK